MSEVDLILRNWQTALRSGEYKQGRTWLKRENNYCCLGVLCEVMGVPEENEEYLDQTHMLPLPVTVLLGISERGEVFLNRGTPEERVVTMTHLNDVANWSFNQLAEVVKDLLRATPASSCPHNGKTYSLKGGKIVC